MLLMASAVLQAAEYVPEKNRFDLVKPVKMGELLLRPTFNACGFYFGTAKKSDIKVEFKKSADSVWQAALTPEFFYEKDAKGRVMSEYRGSVVKLAEDTAYDLRIMDGEKLLAQGKFHTWSSNVPVGKTVYLTAEDFLKPYVISAQGTPDSWIRYTAKPGTVFKGLNYKPMIEVKKAKYILIDGLTLSGGNSKNVITIENSKAVRVQNCEIFNWGLVGKPRYDQFGRYFLPNMNRKAYGINWNGAIAIFPGSTETVVERCFIHSPRSHANSWFYSHPAGPQAIMLHKPDHSTVIRYNDFVGSNDHRFNDAVESVGNFHSDGGINRDADVYGNYMIYCNDDNIELDGGQQNVRCFWNHFEGALCGVSIQGCMVSPVYVFENIFAGMCEQFGIAGQTIKTTGDRNGDNATAYIFNNTLVRDGSGMDMRARLNSHLRNNIFTALDKRNRINISKRRPSPGSTYAANSVSSVKQIERDGIERYITKYTNYEHGNYLPTNPQPAVAIPNFLPDGGIRGAFQLENTLVLPYRPIPFTLDRTRIGEVSVKNNSAAPESVQITASVGGKNFKSAYAIRKNPGFDWFEVTPANGIMKSGDKIVFTVKFNPRKMNNSFNYRGAFLVRLANGFSRPVTVEVKTDYVQPFKLDKKGDTAIYINAFKPSSVTTLGTEEKAELEIVGNPMALNGKNVISTTEKVYEYKVNITKKGRYYFMLHGTAAENKHPLMVSVDNDDFERSKQQLWNDRMTWSMLTPGRDFGNMLRHYDLEPGIHTVRLYGMTKEYPVEFDGLVVTDNPGSFEPRP